MTAYTEVVKQVFDGFGSTNASSLASAVVDFEIKLANVTPDAETQENVTMYYNPLTLEETRQLVPEISFGKIISSLAPSGYKPDRVIVGSPSYMKSLSSILQNTTSETIRSFLGLKIIQGYAYAVEDPKVKPIKAFRNQLSGKDPEAVQERWRKCIRILDAGLPWSLSRFYILDSFSEGSKKLGDEIIRDIKEQFIFTLDQASWMSPDVRKLAKEKVGNIVQLIGYSTRNPNVADAEDVKKYYNGLEISNANFFENELATARFDSRRAWSKLGKPTVRHEWDMSMPTVNAYYNPPGNEIAFPAGVMQPPTFYGDRTPKFLTYGAFGSVSGHELSHGKLKKKKKKKR